MNFKIRGFGACMIAGYPLPPERGFLQQAAQHLRDSGEVDLEIVAMGGFPVARAQKHFSKRILSQRPDVVVLQFGSTDANAPLRRGIGVRRLFKKHVRITHPFNQTVPAQNGVSPLPPLAIDLVKWQLRSLGSELLLVQPTTPLETYLTAILKMVDECREANCIIIVLSPFVMGSSRSNRFARHYAHALKEQINNIPGACFLDAHRLLSQQPRSKMLLRDGFHLSPEAHKRLGSALGELLTQVSQRDSATSTAAR